MPAVAASRVSECQGSCNPLCGGSGSFTLSFLHPGQQCQLKQSLYLATGLTEVYCWKSSKWPEHRHPIPAVVGIL